MPELLAHLVGDYVLQNHWMALKKTGDSLVAVIHASLYGIPFIFLGASPLALWVVIATHAVIDRFQIAKYWCEFWGIGNYGWVAANIATGGHAVRVEGGWDCPPGSPVGFPDAPPFLAIWLRIIVDNTLHLTINHLALAYL